MGAQLSLPESAWRALTWSWTSFFAAMGVVNLWVAFHYDTDTWVNFKLFGGMGLMVLFVLGQAVYLSKYMKTEADQS
jgi:intracellular septation protein